MRPKILLFCADNKIEKHLKSSANCQDFQIIVSHSNNISNNLKKLTDYFLVLFDITSYAKNQELMVKIFNSNTPLIVVYSNDTLHLLEITTIDSRTFDVINIDMKHNFLCNKVHVLAEIFQSKHELKSQVQKLKNLNYEFIEVHSVLKHNAQFDYLTNIPNRRKLEDDYLKFYSSCHRTKAPISVLMIDLDDFKGYNDFYGHIKGDEALKIVAKTIESSLLRPLDTVGRYGGEEFLVILPNTDLLGGITVANKILENIRDLRIMHSPYSNHEFVTVSIGVATQIPKDILKYASLIELSDLALYEAKSQGKNCYHANNNKKDKTK